MNEKSYKKMKFFLPGRYITLPFFPLFAFASSNIYHVRDRTFRTFYDIIVNH